MKTNSIKLVAVGDVLLGDFPLKLGFGVRSIIEEKGKDFIFKNVKHILGKGDICFGNLECVLSDHGYKKDDIKSTQMRGSPEFVKILSDAGFNVMSVANNHIMQHGCEAFTDTIEVLKEGKIVSVGVAKKEKKCLPKFIHINGVKVCFLGYSFHFEKYSPSHTLYTKGDKAEVIADIKENRKKSDVVIVSLHWGDEFIDIPSPKQIKHAHAFVDAGASLIIGQHPHILQGIEKYNNGLIAYSLGNFVFDFWQKRLRESMILECCISKERVESFKVVPVYINDNYQPVPLEGARELRLADKINSLSKRISAVELDNPNTHKSYSAKVKRLERFNKLENRLFFMKNILKYDNKIIAQSLLNFIKSRIKK